MHSEVFLSCLYAMFPRTSSILTYFFWSRLNGNFWMAAEIGSSKRSESREPLQRSSPWPREGYTKYDTYAQNCFLLYVFFPDFTAARETERDLGDISTDLLLGIVLLNIKVQWRTRTTRSHEGGWEAGRKTWCGSWKGQLFSYKNIVMEN